MIARSEAPTARDKLETRIQRILALPVIGLLTSPFGVKFFWRDKILVTKFSDGAEICRDPKTHRTVSTQSPRRMHLS